MLTSFSAIFFTGCQKDLKPDEGPLTIHSPGLQKITLPNATNPFSLRNVQKAKATLAAQSITKNNNNTSNLIIEPQFVYFKFNPNELTGDQFAAIKDDSTVFMLEIPFANPAIYDESFALDNAKAEQLKDGNIYGVTSISNSNVFAALTSRPQTQAVFLDTLVQIAEEDTALQFQAFREIGYTETQINDFRIYLFKRPHGYVRYKDNDLGLNHLEPVRGMVVWALVFGIPALSSTDDNGYYQIPWRYSIGTIMGTMAKNDKVVIRPVNTNNVLSLISQFLTGAMTIENWFSPCQMRYDIDFNYTTHSQARYWCQILNGYYFHYQYCKADNIDRTPKGMVCYAEWSGGNDFKDASSPLLNFIGANPNLVQAHMFKLYGFLLPEYFAFLIAHQLPDNTYAVGSNSEPVHYSSRLAQIIFHELGHASHFNRVGNNWYAKMAAAESLFAVGAGYGNGSYTDAGKVQVGESWAEFIGTQYARRRYGDIGYKFFNESFSISALTLPNIDLENIYSNTWIPTGFYYDLIDTTNAVTEDWDKVGGSAIHNMYNVFNSNTNNMCDFIWQFKLAYPTFFTTSTEYDLTNHYWLLNSLNFNCY